MPVRFSLSIYLTFTVEHMVLIMGAIAHMQDELIIVYVLEKRYGI